MVKLFSQPVKSSAVEILCDGFDCAQPDSLSKVSISTPEHFLQTGFRFSQN
jgi:hypothetical protein